MLTHTQMLQMPHAITKRGGKVFVVDKWGTRGVRPMQGRGFMDHWIVSNPNKREARQTLGVIVNGHSTLPGPLANFYVGWDGEIGCVAALSANHGGVGSWKGYSGNHFFAGVEAEGPPLTDATIEALAVLAAAFYDVSGQHPRDWLLSHQEYAPNRKVDIGPAIHTVRNRAIHLVDNHIFDTEDDMTPEQANQLDFLYKFATEQERAPQGWAYSAQGANDTREALGIVKDISTRLRVPGYPFDYLPHIVNQNTNIAAQVAAIEAIREDGGVDVDALAAKLGEILPEDIVKALAEKLAS